MSSPGPKLDIGSHDGHEKPRAGSLAGYSQYQRRQGPRSERSCFEGKQNRGSRRPEGRSVAGRRGAQASQAKVERKKRLPCSECVG